MSILATGTAAACADNSIPLSQEVSRYNVPVTGWTQQLITEWGPGQGSERRFLNKPSNSAQPLEASI